MTSERRLREKAGNAIRTLAERFFERRVAEEDIAFASNLLTKIEDYYGGEYGTKGTLLRLIVRYFPQHEQTWDLITQRVHADQNASIRQMALQLLATGQKEVPATWDLITQYAHDDQNSNLRRKVLQLLATRYELDQRSRTMLSRDLDGLAPYIDPSEPISQDWVKRCAVKLGMPVDKVLEMFQKLVQVLPLKLDMSV